MVRSVVGGLVVAAVIAAAETRVNRSDGNGQATAIGSLRAISSAQSAYAAVNGGYARSLRALGLPCPGSSNGFISPDFDHDPTVKNGYEVRLHASSSTRGRPDCRGEATATEYYATAVPVAPRRETTPAFAVDSTQTIWLDESGAAPTPPFHETSTIRRLR